MDVAAWIQTGVMVLVAGAGLFGWFSVQMARERDDRLAVERDLAAYKLHVAQHHVTNVALRETEERLINALEKMSARVETMAARIENAFVEMAKARA